MNDDRLETFSEAFAGVFKKPDGCQFMLIGVVLNANCEWIISSNFESPIIENIYDITTSVDGI